MLLKNGKEFLLDDPANKKELDKFLAAVPNFSEKEPIAVIYHPSRVKWNDLNKKYDKPESLGFPFRMVVNRPGIGNETWIYCENYESHKATGAILTRTPWTFQLSRRKVIKYADKDLAFFLWLSPYCNNGENPDKARKDFLFEDRENDARIMLEREKLDARVKSLLLNDDTEGGLSDSKVEELARAYQLPVGMGAYETRQKLYYQVSREKNGLKNFITLMEDPYKKDLKVMLNKARTDGVIAVSGIQIEKGTGNNQAWKLFDRNGKVIRVFAKFRKSKSGGVASDKLLYDMVENDPTLLKEITEAVETRQTAEVDD
jgi:hypothetical protein